ncbi:hypothetical protein AALC25_12155 [Lachnospiraceae bacterium 29-84]
MSGTTPPEMGAGTEKRHSDKPAENNRPYAAERVSHTIASRETVLTVSAPTGFKSRLFFRDTLKPIYKIKERTDVMNEAKNKNLFIRVSEKEKTIIERNAKKCGLSVSEYLRQRALGYMPRAVLPEIFFSFNDKLDELCVAVEGKITADTEEKIITLIDGITAELIFPQKEKAVL